jgi:hypothetical protein
VPNLTDADRLAQMELAHHPHYFIDTLPTSSESRLVALLDARYPIVISGVDLRVYDLTRTLGETDGTSLAGLRTSLRQAPQD